MIKHIVMWRFAGEAEGRTREQNMQWVADHLKNLVGRIPQIRSMEIGEDVLHSPMSYDMALVMEFDSIADMQIYKEHPEHKKVSEYVKKVREKRVCVDFEM